MTMVSSPASNGYPVSFKIANKSRLLSNGFRSSPQMNFVPRSVALDARASSSHFTENRPSSSNSNNDGSAVRKIDISFTFVGLLEHPPTPKYVLESNELDETLKLDGSPSTDAFSSGNSTYHDSTPASSNGTPNSITNELTNIPDLKDLEEARKDVRIILSREETRARFSTTPTKECSSITPLKGVIEGCYAPTTPTKERPPTTPAKESFSTPPTKDRATAASSRKRLLSDRGEQELANFPVIDMKNVKNGWKGCPFNKAMRGAGLVNYSNDCFLNVVLQSVVHTSQLARFIVESHEWNICRTKSQSCFTCSLRQHIVRASAGQQNVLSASWIRQSGHLQRIFPSHRRGYQEDAHEMLTLLLAALEPPVPRQPNGLHGIQPPPRSSPIEQIFGGSLRNQIRCNSCNTVHTNYERIREINLGLTRKVRTAVRDLLRDFFADEQLQHFLCKNCKMKRTATRSTAILRAPSVLMIQLKRFNLFGGKNRLSVDTDATIFLGDYVYNNEPISYKLNGVIEHIGSGVNFGHYISAWRGFNEKSWFKFDDADVDEISEASVRSMEPYILFYSRIGSEAATSSSQPQKRPCFSAPEHLMKKTKLFSTPFYA